MSALGASEPQTVGRSGRPNSVQRRSSSRLGQRRPAGLPPGSPGIGLLIDGAMQQAPQPGRQGREGLEGMAPLSPFGRQGSPVSRSSCRPNGSLPDGRFLPLSS